MNNSLVKTRIELLLLFLLYAIILPRVYMTFDVGYYTDWALHIYRHGLQNAYGSTTNYPPVFLYALYVYDLLQGSEANIIHNINSIKLLFVFFDFLPVIILCGFRQRILSFNIPYLYLLINVAYLFNAMVWGQMDGMYTNMIFIAIVAGFFYPAVAAMLFVLAINTKLQAIIFAPLIAIVLSYSIRNIKTLITCIVAAAALQFIIIIPFVISGNVGRMLYVYTHNVDYFHKLSLSAFNIWYLVTSGNPYFTDDTKPFLLLSYRNTGLLLFAATSATVLWPLFRRIWSDRKANATLANSSYEMLFLGSGLIALFFFYFNTQMHERYAHPIIIFFFFYGVVSKNYKLYILASIPYFLSLDKSFSFPDGYLPIIHYKIIFASKIIALWYTATLVYSSYLFYKLVKKPALLNE